MNILKDLMRLENNLRLAYVGNVLVKLAKLESILAMSLLQWDFPGFRIQELAQTMHVLSTTCLSNLCSKFLGFQNLLLNNQIGFLETS